MSEQPSHPEGKAENGGREENKVPTDESGGGVVARPANHMRSDNGSSTVRTANAFKLVVEIAAPLIIAWFAYSTDSVYHRLASIAEQQSEIMASENLPMFHAELDMQKNPATGIYDQDRIIFSNVGAPIVVNNEDMLTTLTLELTPTKPPLTGTQTIVLPTNGFYGATIMHNSNTGVLFETIMTASRGQEFEWYKQLLKNGYQGQLAFLSMRHLLAITYTNRARALNTEYLAVDDYGAKYVSKDAWDAARAANQAGFSKGTMIDMQKPPSDLTEIIGRLLATQHSP